MPKQNSTANTSNDNGDPLAISSHPAFMTQAEAAEYLRVSTRTLERLRATGTGPRFTRLGRRTVYATSELDAFASSRTFTSTAEADAARNNAEAS